LHPGFNSRLVGPARRELASDLLKHNDRADLLGGTQLNEAVQRILDRILFLRICEDRDIDTGRPLDRLVRSWRDDGDPSAARRARQQPLELREEPPAHYGGSGLRAPKGTLWHTLGLGGEVDSVVLQPAPVFLPLVRVVGKPLLAVLADSRLPSSTLAG
jgi:hypothetical protein